MSQKSLGLSTVALFLLIFTSSLVFIFNEDMKRINEEMEDSIESINRTEWTLINQIIEDSEERAKQQSNLIANNIRKEILKQYTDLNQLKYDMDNPREDSKFSNIINKEIKNKFINVDNDNNDPFVALNTGIYADKSINGSSKNGEKRTWENEIHKHYNKYLAREAIKAIIDGREDLFIFWEYLKNNNPNHKIFKKMDKDELFKVFMREGIEGLKSYEVLTFTHIDSGQDIFGIEDVDNLGRRQQNRKIIVVQGFSIYDTLKTNHQLELNFFDERREEIKKKYEFELKNKKQQFVLTCLILVSTFLGILITQNISISRKEKESLKRE